ncbi:YjbH domain-containing protein [Pseudoalteromonas sp. JBTF-M23]|uniref:YjbH domain-containing protein n=1 Tax=Pseudoalteromonas caenipelagi TaxID=2726988 RepID=A0A849VGA0_9GAMM|nr:YjbH domain-containing protein [Pseudoalteromonas caenipelagi]NOU51758.1 YjbH domain-containing protein [Pseudoalteromonas caenipelagi]
MSKINKIFAVSVVLASAPVLADSQITSYSSFAGYTGLFNTPNAEILEKGVVDFSYNNQLDLRGAEYIDGHNFIFSAGVYDGLEVSGQIASTTMHDNMFEKKGQTRDLSFNLKYQLPFIPKNWFNLAIGGKDLGGAANNYETYYLAGSKEWNDFRFSAGFAVSDRTTGQMDGAFAGIEWQPLDWFALQVEHDADAVNAGLRLTVPKEWIYDAGTLTLSSRFYSNTDHADKDTYWGLNFSMPLFEQATLNDPTEAAPAPILDNHNKREAAFKAHYQKQRELAQKPLEEAKQEVSERDKFSKSLTLQTRELKNALIDDGFEAVSVGFNREPHIVVSFENFVFNRNDIDAIGLVLGRIAEHIDEPDAKYSIQLLNRGMPMLFVRGNVDNYREFINTSTTPDMDIRRGEMEPLGSVSWVGMPNANSPYFRPRLTIGPALNQRTATELGVYDFSLAVKADLDLPMWYGGGLSISAQSELAKTDDYETGKAFGRLAEKDGITQATLYQSFALPYGIYNQTHVGFFREFNQDFTGIKNETVWLSENGRHQFKADIGYLEYQDYDTDRDYQALSYRYNWIEKDVSFHASAGRFFYDDSGVKVEARFWFGDSYISVFAQDTDVQLAGVSFSIPLTPRKDMVTTSYGQIKGNAAWRHSVSTRIGESHNNVTIGRAKQIETPINVTNTLLNQGRLSSSYIYANLARLREVYLTHR